MRALRSRTVQEDSEDNEHLTENSEQIPEETISKKAKRKKLKKHVSDSESNEQLLEDSKHTAEEHVSKKAKRKKSKKRNENPDHIMEDSEHVVSKKSKRRKSKKHTSDSESIGQDENNKSKKDKRRTSGENGTLKSDWKPRELRSSIFSDNVATSTVSKPKKPEIYLEDDENDESKLIISKIGHTSNSESNGQDENDKFKKIKRSTSFENYTLPQEIVKKKKSKKHKSLIQANSTVTSETVLNTSTESQQSTKKPKKFMKKRVSTSRELRSTIFNSPINFNNVATSTVIKPETYLEEDENESKLIKSKSGHRSDSESNEQDENDKSKKIKKRTSGKNDTVPQEIVKKKKSKKHMSLIEANSNEAVLNTSIESTKKSKKFDWKPREMRSTIFNSPINFDKVVTSTVIKHKRPEIYLEEDENNESKLKKSKNESTSDVESNEQDEIDKSKKIRKRTSGENYAVPQEIVRKKKSKKHNSLIQANSNEAVLNTSIESKKFELKPRELRSTIFNSPINFTNVVTSTVIKPKRPDLEEDENEQNAKRQSKIVCHEETFNKVSTNKMLNETVDNISQSKTIVKTKRSTLSSLADPDETYKLNKSVKQQRLTVENQRESFNKQPKKISIDSNSVIAIFDSPEISTVKQNTFNKSTDEPEVTSDEEMETDDSLETSKASETFNMFPKNKPFLVQNTVITISDSPEKTILQRNTFNKSDPQPELTSDEEEISNKLSESSKLKPQNQSLNRTKTTDASTSRRDTFYKTPKNMVNTSGDWKIENNGENKKPNGTFEIENKENVSGNSSRSKGNSTIVNEHFSLSPKDKSVRKKWLKFPRHSSDAQSVLDQISSPKLKDKMVQKIMDTPTNLYQLQKPPIAPSSLSVQTKNAKTPKSLKKSPFKSNKKLSAVKSASKRTVMPNFAQIHQRAFQKMENLSEYSERKKLRAQMLLNPGSKRKSLKLNENKPEETKAKSSRQLFTNEGTKYNRFGFKIGEQDKKPTINHVAKPTAQVVIAKPVVKPSVFARTEVVAIANKNKVVSNHREKRRDTMKGVRTNRRFELLMQMRNKQQ